MENPQTKQESLDAETHKFIYDSINLCGFQFGKKTRQEKRAVLRKRPIFDYLVEIGFVDPVFMTIKKNALAWYFERKTKEKLK